jgi:MFS transporter, DHA1 family, inner membrane transport protein
MALDTSTAPPSRPAAAYSGPRLAAALTALAVGGFAIGTSEFVTMGLLPQISAGIDESIPTGGHVISAYALGVVIGAPLIAALSTKLPRRALLVGLMAAYGLGNALSAVATDYSSLMFWRFVAGLPHGAYFGVSALVAAAMVPPHRKGRAVASVLMGLSVAQVVGVPSVTWMGQQLGWRSAYLAAAALAVGCVIAVLLFVPRVPSAEGASLRGELSALGRPQVLLTLLVGTIGFGGIFAVNSYIAPIVTEVTGQPESFVPWALLALGLGSVCGVTVGGRLADWSLNRSLVMSMVAMTLVLTVFGVAARNPWSLIAASFVLSVTATVMVVSLQMRLMHEAGESEMLGAALSHSALNIANGLGAWLGGLVIAAGFGYTAPNLVGALLGVVGLAILAFALLLARHTSGQAAR